MRIWEKRMAGLEDTPSFFPEITDYLTQINNLCPLREVAKEGGGLMFRGG